MEAQPPKRLHFGFTRGPLENLLLKANHSSAESIIVRSAFPRPTTGAGRSTTTTTTPPTTTGQICRNGVDYRTRTRPHTGPAGGMEPDERCEILMIHLAPAAGH